MNFIQYYSGYFFCQAFSSRKRGFHGLNAIQKILDKGGEIE